VRPERHATLMLLVFGLACGPSRSDPTETMGMGATGTVGLDDAGTLDEDESTGDLPPCGDEVLEGELVVDNRTDVRSIRRYRVVAGHVSVMRREEQDLSFLECLEEIHRDLAIGENRELRTTAGLDRLRRLDGDIYLRENYRLEVLEGLGTVRELAGLLVESTESLRTIDLPHVERIGWLWIARCSDPFQPQPGGNWELTSLEGFPSLVYLGELVLRGTKHVTSIDGLRVIRDNGGALDVAIVQANASLPEDHVHEVLDYIGNTNRIVCLNLDGEEVDECPCGIPN
jgi:hypothetical protein